MDVAKTPRRGVREIKTLLWVALGLYLLLALFTFSSNDPGWSRLGGSAVANGAGAVGAVLSDLLFTFLGRLAYVIPFFCFLQLFWLWRPVAAPVSPAWQWLAFAIALASGAALAALHILLPGEALANTAGGILGHELGQMMLSSFGLMGGTVLLLTIFLIAITLATGLSWLALMDALGKALWEGTGYVAQAAWSLVEPQFRAWQEKRAIKKEFAATQPRFDLNITNRRVKAQLEPLAEDEPPFLPSAPLPKAETKVEPKSVERLEPAVFGRAEPVLGLEPVVAAPKPKPKAAEPRPTPTIMPLEEAIKPSPRVEKEKQRSLFEAMPVTGELPSLALLDPPDHSKRKGYSVEALEGLSRLLEIKLKEFNVDAQVVAVLPGPVITRFEIQPAPGVKVARITNIAKDLARSMAMVSVRVVEVIPGKSVVGIEVPNEDREMVRFSEVLSSKEYDSKDSPLTLALGKDIAGRPVVADLARMPHLLVAGTTGSGKSVGVNAMILSMLFKATPADLRLIMIDPKMLELSVYDKIPHLLTPVVTDMKDAANALRWCVGEMERRYKLMAAMGVRNLAGFNKKVEEGEGIPDPLWKASDTALETEPPVLTKLPYIVVVIDEFADMMMVVGKKVEELIARIAQKARAAGIHLILATQRPSVDVITGLIKANVPTRIAFQVSSKIDSRTILDQGGADQLLGHGDMLFLPPGTSLTERVHGAFVSDEEVHRVATDWRARGEPNYIDEILEGSLEVTDGGKGFGGSGDDMGSDPEADPLYDEAVAFVMETRRPSISFVQRKFKIGYNRAARLIEAMEMAGIVSPMQGNGQRDVIVPGRE